MAPLIENYRYKYLARGKWIFVPSVQGERRSAQILRFLSRVEFPGYFFHYEPGGHVAALHKHLENEFFFKIDIQNFFYSIARNRVHRALASCGMSGAPTYAKWSTVKSPYADGPRYVLPIGFRQSPHIASIVLMNSPVFDALERARDNGVFVSVYLDDIIGSSSDEKILHTAYADILGACVEANLVPNEQKLVAPSKAIVAFNCDLKRGRVQVTEARVAKFNAEGRGAVAQQAFEAYRIRIAAANQTASEGS
jgi:hypothetical protein